MSNGLVHKKAPSLGGGWDVVLLEQGVNQDAGWATRGSLPAGPELNGAGGRVQRISKGLDAAQIRSQRGPWFGEGGWSAHCSPLEEGRECYFHGARVFGLMTGLPCNLHTMHCRFLRRVKGVDRLPVHLDLVLRGRVHHFLHTQSIGTLFASVKGEI